MSDYGFERFLKFVNESNNGYLLISGGGEPFEKKEYVFKTVESAITDKIVIVSNGLWAKKYEEAKKIIDKLYISLSNRNKKTDVTLRISIDTFHAKQCGIEAYENIIKIFENDYCNKTNFYLKIHTIMSDDTIYKLAKKNEYIISKKSYYNSSDNTKIFKLVPRKFYIYTKNKYKIEVGVAKLFYPNVTPNLNHTINNKAIKVFDTDISDSETCNPSTVNSINGKKGLDFWINYNGNVTTWQNEQFDNIMNIYTDSYEDIIKKTFNNLLSFSFIENGYYHREKIILDVNNKAVLRSKLSNMRDLSTAMLLHERKTILYYYIMIIKEYYKNLKIDKHILSKELIDVIDLKKDEIKKLYQISNYTIIDDYIMDGVTELEMHDLYYMIKLGEYDINEQSIKRGINYLNQRFGQKYKTIDDIIVLNSFEQTDRIIEKLTRMEYKSKEKCLFINGLISKNINLIKQVSKSDLHAHATRSGKKEYFESKYNTKIIDAYINEIKKIQHKFYNAEFIPELCLVRGNINKKIVYEILDKKYFKSLDLVGNEELGVDDAVEIYEYSKKYNMIRRCHVGEFSDDSHVIDAILKLELNEIQHGLSAIKNDEILNLIRKRNIKINLCPQTNLILGRINNLYEPLRKLIDNNVKTSINTDDLLIFNRSISDIYIELYNTQKFSVDELNDIRIYNL